MLEQNKDIVRRFVEETQVKHNLNAIDEFFSPDFVDHTGAASANARDNSKQFFSMLLAAFPDLRATIHEQIAEGDKVMTRKTMSGTHRGEFLGIPPTGRSISYDVIDIFSLSNGKLTGHWGAPDMLGLMRQLGATP